FHLAYAMVAIVVISWIGTVSAGDVLFWTVDVNRGFIISPAEKIAGSFAAHFGDLFGRDDIVGSRYPHLLIALVLLVLAIERTARRNQQPRPVVPLLLFVAMILVTAVLTQWRENYGIKSITIFGLTVGKTYLALHELVRDRPPLPGLLLAPIFGFALLQVNFLVALGTYG